MGPMAAIQCSFPVMPHEVATAENSPLSSPNFPLRPGGFLESATRRYGTPFTFNPDDDLDDEVFEPRHRDARAAGCSAEHTRTILKKGIAVVICAFTPRF